ncbi:MAG: radical SAM protein [Deltaproteobacteria bacterium]|nr:radical SAM protein [Deltaproteobacteria bacterium]
MTTKNYFQNSSTLKIDLMLRGIRVSEGLKGANCRKGRAGAGIDLILPKGTLVNVPCGEDFTEHSPYELKKARKGLVITDGTREMKVTAVPEPRFYSDKTSTGVPFCDIATVHGSYAVITPSPKCEFFDSKVECRYCAGNFDMAGADARLFTVEEVLETVKAILDEGVCEIIYLSIGFSRGGDGGIELLRPYIKAIKNHFNCLVAVEALPPKEDKWIDEAYALGADSLLYNLEIFDSELFKILCPGREELIGRKRYLDALKYAATVFPNGTVASHLIVGLEPPGSTCMGIDYLTEIGVVPILPVYRPQPGKALRMGPLTAEVIIPVYKHLYTAVKKNKINTSWVRDISMVTTPIESKLLSGEEKSGVLSLFDGFYKTKLGIKTAWGLSTLRRKLRVKDKGEQ